MILGQSLLLTMLIFKIRTAFERWMNLINKHEDNSGLTDPTAYQKDLFVRQLGRSNVSGPTPQSDAQLPVLKMYKFHGTFPTIFQIFLYLMIVQILLKSLL